MHRERLNILNLDLLNALRSTAEYIANAPNVKAVVLYGGPKAFSAGADIRELAQLTDETVAAHARSMQKAVSAVARIPVPVIAAICGPAVGGGCELALAADFRVCSEDSIIGLPEILLGVIPTGGGTRRLAPLVGLSRAKELVYSGRSLTAPEALRIGLVDGVAPRDDVYHEAQQWATRYSDSSISALRAAKSAIEYGHDAGLENELHNFITCFTAPDRELGMRTFLEEGPGKVHFGFIDPGPPMPARASTPETTDHPAELVRRA